jgi:hypothetical protein
VPLAFGSVKNSTAVTGPVAHDPMAITRESTLARATCHCIERGKLLSTNKQIATVQRSARCGSNHSSIGDPDRRLNRIEPGNQNVADSLDSIRRNGHF